MKPIIYKTFILSTALGLLSGCNIDFNGLIAKYKKSCQSILSTKSPQVIIAAEQKPVDPRLDAENHYQSAESIEEQAMALEMFQRLARSNDMHASCRLGEMYLYGIGTEKNPITAMQWFRKAAINGLPKAMFQMGNMYRSGLGSDYSLSKAIDWYKKAANLGNVKAMLALGEIYRGYGIHPDYNKAMEYYVSAAGMGSLEAEYQMVRLITNDLVDKDKYSNKITSILYSLKKAAQAGDVNAMVGLGDHYIHQLNHNLALEYYKQAVSLDFPPALLRLGLLYLYGEVVEKNYSSAIDFFTRAANFGNVVSQYHLGEIHRKGLGVPRDLELARSWYNTAVKNNFPKAFARLADLYFSVKGGIEPDLDTAIDLYTKAATAGDSYSGLLLSIFYAKGFGVPQNLPLSVHWYNTVEQNKDQLLAKFDVARVYETGFGFKKDYQEAVKWYSLAAEGGFSKAQCKLAELYANGLGLQKNYDRAIYWYQKAADQGYNYAQYSLGLLLQSNLSKKLNNPQAAYYFMKKAATNSYKPAQYSLALMLLQGTGVTANPVQAYSWLHIALNEGGGYESNPELMDVLINKLEPAARNRAVLLVQRYRDKYNLSNIQEF